MAKKFIDTVGIAYVFSKVKALLNGKADRDEVIPIVNATSADGVAYTATIDDLTELKAGKMIVFIPDKTTTVTNPTLNVNGLGAVAIRRKLSMGAASMAQGYMTTMFYANRPVLLMYDASISASNYWIPMEFTKPAAGDLYGTVGIDHGGTDATTALEAINNLGGLTLANLTGTDYDIPSGADLNTYTTPGAYRIGSASIAASLTNGPSFTSAGFRLIVSYTSHGAGLIQIAIYNHANLRIIARTQTSAGTWGAWGELRNTHNTMKQLWSGTWYSTTESISVPDISSYKLFLVRFYNSESNGTTNYTAIAVRVGNSLRGVGGATNGTYNQFITSIDATCNASNNTMSSLKVAAFTHTQNSNHSDCYDWAVNEVWGIL